MTLLKKYQKAFKGKGTKTVKTADGYVLSYLTPALFTARMYERKLYFNHDGSESRKKESLQLAEF